MADSIETLTGMTDDQLREKLGQNKALAKFKTDLARIAKITDKEARKYAEGRLNDVLNPTVYANEIGYIADSAERKACKKTTPESFVEDCACVGD